MTLPDLARFAPDPAEETDADIGFVLRLGRALHAYGTAAHRLEETLTLVCDHLGLEGQFFSTPTSIFAAFGAYDRQRTFLTRVQPGDTNLAALAALDEVARDVLAGRADVREGSARVDAICRTPPATHGVLATLAAFAVASAGVARFLDASGIEVLVAGGLGLLTGLLALLAGRVAGVAQLFEPAAAFAVSLAAAVASVRLASFSPFTVTLAGLVILLPGYTLTTGMSELATRHLASGTARLSGATMIFLGIAFGVAMGTRVAELLVGAPPNVVTGHLPAWTQWPALLATPVALAVILRAARRDTPWIVGICIASFLAANAGARLLGPGLGAFVGALVTAVLANLFARLARRPAAVLLTPGIVLLVPGSIGYRSLLKLLQDEVIVGVETAVQVLIIGTSLVAGLLLGNVVLPARVVSASGATMERRVTGGAGDGASRPSRPLPPRTMDSPAPHPHLAPCPPADVSSPRSPPRPPRPRSRRTPSVRFATPPPRGSGGARSRWRTTRTTGARSSAPSISTARSSISTTAASPPRRRTSSTR